MNVCDSIFKKKVSKWIFFYLCIYDFLYVIFLCEVDLLDYFCFLFFEIGVKINLNKKIVIGNRLKSVIGFFILFIF